MAQCEYAQRWDRKGLPGRQYHRRAEHRRRTRHDHQCGEAGRLGQRRCHEYRRDAQPVG
jgi:hypothetical protein